jgi:hypothetical protein
VYCLYCGFYLPLDGGTGALPGFSPAGRILESFRICCIISNMNNDITIKTRPHFSLSKKIVVCH